MQKHKQNFKKNRPISKFDPGKYGDLWGSISFELMTGVKATNPIPPSTQPKIGTLVVGKHRMEITFSESNRIIEQLYDAQNIYNTAKRMNMLEKGTGTPRDIEFTQYDSDGNIIATNKK